MYYVIMHELQTPGKHHQEYTLYKMYVVYIIIVARIKHQTCTV